MIMNNICKLLRPGFTLSRLRAFSVPTSGMSTFTLPDGSKVQAPRLPEAIADIYKPGQMYANQSLVPPLPVMPLKQTLDKYLLSVEPLLTSEEISKTRKVVEEFGKPGGIGEQLQQKLMERGMTHDNWLIDWWNEVAYLGYRDPVVINVSPAISYPQLRFHSQEQYIQNAAKFMFASLKIFHLIQVESLPPDVHRGKPYCMWQYPRLYGCRIPGKQVDTWRRNGLPEQRHMIIMRKGHIYKLTTFYETPSGEIAPAPAKFIIDQLHWILNDAEERSPHPVGILTTQQRDKWYEARKRLLEDSLNQRSIEDIETAILCVCFDEKHPDLVNCEAQESFSDVQKSLVATRCLHGNGSQHNTINRWFDITSQVVLGEDGGYGTILEHSALDGPPAVFTNIMTMDFVERFKYDFLDEISDVDPSSLKPAERLEWNLSPDSVRDIDEAKHAIDKNISDVDFYTFSFDEFGKNFPKSLRLSPDGFIQNAIQLAYYKLYGRTTAMYESGGTRWFKYGRTDTIRSTTNASHAFLKTMMNPLATPLEKSKSLAESIKAHSKYTMEAISGKGIDRHLLGLRILAGQAGISMPDIFNDVAYSRSTHFCLSSSQVPIAQYKIFLCFGAVVPDGYGVCYNPQEDQLLISISSYYSSHETDSILFANKLKESLIEMKEAVLAAKMPNSKL